jgi:hypothetical protein
VLQKVHLGVVCIVVVVVVHELRGQQHASQQQPVHVQRARPQCRVALQKAGSHCEPPSIRYNRRQTLVTSAAVKALHICEWGCMHTLSTFSLAALVRRLTHLGKSLHVRFRHNEAHRAAFGVLGNALNIRSKADRRRPYAVERCALLGCRCCAAVTLLMSDMWTISCQG